MKAYGPTKACMICKSKPRKMGGGYVTCGDIKCKRQLVMYRRGMRKMEKV